jgi:phosphoserine aminotransferase
VLARGDAAVASVAKDIGDLLERETIALDIGAYRDAPPGLRIWCGGTVEEADLAALTAWLDWAFAEAKAKLAQAA